MAKPLTLLVTGSRDWPDATWLFQHLDKGYATCLFAEREMQLVHGACPRGADLMADTWANEVGVNTIRMPADWNTHGRKAGYLRNEAMVVRVRWVLGPPFVCVAFNYNNSGGTTHCANLAEEAGIPTHRIALTE